MPGTANGHSDRCYYSSKGRVRYHLPHIHPDGVETSCFPQDTSLGLPSLPRSGQLTRTWQGYAFLPSLEDETARCTLCSEATSQRTVNIGIREVGRTYHSLHNPSERYVGFDALLAAFPEGHDCARKGRPVCPWCCISSPCLKVMASFLRHLLLEGSSD